jgi:hypothetical protein
MENNRGNSRSNLMNGTKITNKNVEQNGQQKGMQHLMKKATKMNGATLNGKEFVGSDEEGGGGGSGINQVRDMGLILIIKIFQQSVAFAFKLSNPTAIIDVSKSANV